MSEVICWRSSDGLYTQSEELVSMHCSIPLMPFLYIVMVQYDLHRVTADMPPPTLGEWRRSADSSLCCLCCLPACLTPAACAVLFSAVIGRASHLTSIQYCCPCPSYHLPSFCLQGGETISIKAVLHRDSGSLGFNIVGGGRPCGVGEGWGCSATAL